MHHWGCLGLRRKPGLDLRTVQTLMEIYIIWVCRWAENPGNYSPLIVGSRREGLGRLSIWGRSSPTSAIVGRVQGAQTNVFVLKKGAHLFPSLGWTKRLQETNRSKKLELRGTNRTEENKSRFGPAPKHELSPQRDCRFNPTPIIHWRHGTGKLLSMAGWDSSCQIVYSCSNVGTPRVSPRMYPTGIPHISNSNL